MTGGAPTGSGRAPRVEAIRSRHTFVALRHASGRARSGPLSVAYLPQSTWSTPQVAYAISRQVGGAVVRNRLRRRLRAIVSEQAAGLPPGAYVVRSGPGGPALEFDELKVAMRRALEKATRSQPGHPVAPSGRAPAQAVAR